MLFYIVDMVSVTKSNFKIAGMLPNLLARYSIFNSNLNKINYSEIKLEPKIIPLFVKPI